jgi:hypothetical protein
MNTSPDLITLVDEPTRAFYQDALERLNEADIPFLVGGAFALHHHTGICRHTKDLDLFLCRDDLDRAQEVYRRVGYTTALTYPHWLAKVFAGEAFIDLIFNLGNGEGPVDRSWFHHAGRGELLGQPVRVIAPEEMIWSKIFTMDRGRYDGADVAHLLRATARTLDWDRLLMRCGRHWRVLLSHLVLFGYVYPAEGALVTGAMRELVRRLQQEAEGEPAADQLCRGTFFSPTQYQIDIDNWHYRDARLAPYGGMTPEQIRIWTEGVLAGK